MGTKTASAQQDKILSECERFGGKAKEAAEIAFELDGRLYDALIKINELEKELENYRK